MLFLAEGSGTEEAKTQSTNKGIETKEQSSPDDFEVSFENGDTINPTHGSLPISDAVEESNQVLFVPAKESCPYKVKSSNSVLSLEVRRRNYNTQIMF